MTALKRILLVMILAAPAAMASIITELAPPGVYSTTVPVGINDTLQIAVTLWNNNNDTTSSALYSGGTYSLINAGEGKGNGSNEATSINPSGTTSTNYFTGTAQVDPGFVTSGGAFTGLKIPSSTTGAYTTFMNAAGIVVGYSYVQQTINNVTSYTSEKAIAWASSTNGAPTSTTAAVSLGAFTSGAFSNAFGINSPSVAANYEIVGTAGATDASLADGYAFFYTKTGGLQHVPGLTSTVSDAYAVNNAGQIAGDETPAGSTQAYVYTPGSGIVLYGTLGDANSSTNAINSSGVTVGFSYDLDGSGDYIDQLATLFMGNAAIDLNSYLPVGSGWVLQDATGINDTDQIVGYGLYNGVQEGFLLDLSSDLASPTPEPASFLLLGVGIALLAAARKFSRPGLRGRF